jgi:transposase
MISPELKTKIRRLYFVEHWKIGTIASQLDVHPDTVRAAVEADRFKQGAAVRKSRHTLLDPYMDFIRATLDQYPRLRATRLFHMLKPRGYQGSVVQLRRVLRTLRPVCREAFLKLQTLPGEEGQADWADFGPVQIGRARRRLSGFVMTLSYSRALWVEFFFDQTLEHLLLAHVQAFESWSGVPRVILYDNLRSVVLDRFADAIRFHPRILELAGHYHFEPRPCRPGRGNEKGRVERAISYLRVSFAAARPFTTLEDFNRQALQWRDQIAHQRPHPMDDQRTVLDLLAEEQGRLLPLPAHRFETDRIVPVRSAKIIYLRFDGNDYSIPPQAVGRPLTLAASPHLVRIFDGTTQIAQHRRTYDRHEQVSNPAHIEALVAEKKKAIASTAATRLQQTVPNIGPFLQAAFQRGEPMGRLTNQLLLLADEYGAEALTAALAEALDRQTPRLSSVGFILARRHRKGRPQPAPVDLSRHPELSELQVPTTKLEVYDELTDDPTK